MKILKALLLAGAMFALPAVAEARTLGLLVGAAEPAINFRFIVSPPPPENMAAEQVNKAIAEAFAEVVLHWELKWARPATPTPISCCG